MSSDTCIKDEWRTWHWVIQINWICVYFHLIVFQGCYTGLYFKSKVNYLWCGWLNWVVVCSHLYFTANVYMGNGSLALWVIIRGIVISNGGCVILWFQVHFLAQYRRWHMFSRRVGPPPSHCTFNFFQCEADRRLWFISTCIQYVF